MHYQRGSQVDTTADLRSPPVSPFKPHKMMERTIFQGGVPGGYYQLITLFPKSIEKPNALRRTVSRAGRFSPPRSSKTGCTPGWSFKVAL